MKHEEIPVGSIHVPYNFSYADATARGAATVTADDVGKFARQEDDNSIWMLTDNDPLTWSRVSTAGGTVDISGTPSAGQIAKWTDANTIEGLATTGSGNAVLATSPSLTTPDIGTPSAGTLTNCTGLPASGIADLDTDGTLAANSDSKIPSQKAVKTYVDTEIAGAGGGGPGDWIVIQDQKTANTAGGTFNSGSWLTRDLNTEVVDTGGHASVSSNQFTLAAGTYRIRALVPGFAVGEHKAKLYNVTDAADVLIGTSEYSQTSTGTSCSTMSFIVGRFTIAGSKTFEIRHRCSNGENSIGFGEPSNYGVVEVYTTVELIRE